jgi:hypothetical protein
MSVRQTRIPVPDSLEKKWMERKKMPSLIKTKEGIFPLLFCLTNTALGRIPLLIPGSEFVKKVELYKVLPNGVD